MTKPAASQDNKSLESSAVQGPALMHAGLRPLRVSSVARLLHTSDRRRRLLALVTAYFDESGAEDRPVFAVAAFLSSERKWKRFDEEWRKELRRRRVSIFHMTDFESRWGEFKDKDWSNDDRTAFIAQLAHIIKNTIIIGVGHAVLLQDFRCVFCPDASGEELLRRAYVFLFHSCLDDFVTHLVPHLPPWDRRIACICEEREGVEGATVEKFQETRRRVPAWGEIFNITPTFASKEAFRPLQSADILAYEGYKHVTNQFLGDQALRPVRKLFTSLDKSRRLWMGYYTGPQLENVRRRLADGGQLWRVE